MRLRSPTRWCAVSAIIGDSYGLRYTVPGTYTGLQDDPSLLDLRKFSSSPGDWASPWSLSGVGVSISCGADAVAITCRITCGWKVMRKREKVTVALGCFQLVSKQPGELCCAPSHYCELYVWASYLLTVMSHLQTEDYYSQDLPCTQINVLGYQGTTDGRSRAQYFSRSMHPNCVGNLTRRLS